MHHIKLPHCHNIIIEAIHGALRGRHTCFFPMVKSCGLVVLLYNSHAAWTIIDQGGDCIACRIAVKEPMNMLQGWTN